ncbi:RNA-binding domain-containing protein [Guyanagaster necrorhizus]|uniref:Probable RNA-binding protein 18 n=1 Tax=Guyanagaster necrorhizus TaxID=856835 RepID=A0A9P7VP78_9AGAR|nr:RNA-binding domain-containing protein [Guyanagaster necrorhizus MCA 3950]KAG7444853.1 RNA-binding domain-containing protein [Guyanagaster necrorhizus MCA 3950]
MASEHLSYPAPEPSSSTSTATPAKERILKDRIYVGNLHPSIDEYSLLQAFSKFGKISKLDFLFHKAGPHKGKPRGYAFVEYENANDAAKALASAHDKPLRGRSLVVTYAHQAPLDQAGGLGVKRKSMMESGRPTTLSMIKGRHKDKCVFHSVVDLLSTGLIYFHRTQDKIAMMEAKLRQMEGIEHAIPHHPSLPAKPPAPINSLPMKPDESSLQAVSMSDAKSMVIEIPVTAKLPEKPMLVPKQVEVKKRVSLAGVKIVKSQRKEG